MSSNWVMNCGTSDEHPVHFWQVSEWDPEAWATCLGRPDDPLTFVTIDGENMDQWHVLSNGVVIMKSPTPYRFNGSEVEFRYPGAGGEG